MVVLDEAQAIKNPATKLARTACQLKRRAPAAPVGHAHGEPPGRAVVGVQLPDAGLPRRPRDLPPGVPQPDREGGRPARQQLLASRVRPFLLRRTKEQVASELPPKTGGHAGDRAQPRASATSTRACACRCTSGCATRSSSAASPAATSPSWRRCSSCARSAATRACSRAASRRQRRQRQVRAAHGHAAQHGRGRPQRDRVLAVRGDARPDRGRARPASRSRSSS